MGINRNIVECKGKKLWQAKLLLFVLIETLWNVKDYRLKKILDTQRVLIETLWNVKEQAAQIQQNKEDMY